MWNYTLPTLRICFPSCFMRTNYRGPCILSGRYMNKNYMVIIYQQVLIDSVGKLYTLTQFNYSVNVNKTFIFIINS